MQIGSEIYLILFGDATDSLLVVEVVVPGGLVVEGLYSAHQASVVLQAGVGRTASKRKG